MADLSVVIPTYRRRDALARTLAALERQTAPPGSFEVLVIDDPVEDDSAAVAAVVRAAERPFTVRQLSREARGVSAARNAGWRTARSPLVAFLGDDILLQPPALAEHLATHAREPDETVGVLGPVMWAAELRRTAFMRWLEEGIQFDFRSLPGDEATWSHFYTSNVSLKRVMLERVDGFDEERFPFLYEDLDVGYRMAAHGFRMIFNRAAVGEHLHPTRLAEWRGRMAATAKAEHTWVTIHPEHEPYFRDRFTAALEGPPGSRLAALATEAVPTDAPFLGRRLAASRDRYYTRALAPWFLDAWRAAVSPEPETVAR